MSLLSRYRISLVTHPSHTTAPLDTMLRSLVIGQYGHYGDSDTIEEAKKRFRDHVEGTASLPADLKGAVFSLALANGDETTFDQLVQVGVVS